MANSLALRAKAREVAMGRERENAHEEKDRREGEEREGRPECLDYIGTSLCSKVKSRCKCSQSYKLATD